MVKAETYGKGWPFDIEAGVVDSSSWYVYDEGGGAGDTHALTMFNLARRSSMKPKVSLHL